MNNIINMVNYYLIHKNADLSIINYLKDKLNKSSLEELIIIQIELLYTDPTDKLVSNLVNYITDKINDLLDDIDLYNLINVIVLLDNKKNILNNEIKYNELNNKEIFKSIENKTFIKLDNETDNDTASRLINNAQDNNFNNNKNKSEINSINIWLNNLENSFNKRCNKSSINDLLDCYIDLLNKNNEIINNYINKLNNIIDDKIYNNDIFETITNIIPELNIIYKENNKEKNKLLDNYLNKIDNVIKERINKLEYKDKNILKIKLNIISKELLNDKNIDNDFKANIINNYLRYL